MIRRRAGETLVIGEEVEVDILEIAANQVKLGIRAPRSIAVARKEILLVGAQNRAASRTISDATLDQLIKKFTNSPDDPISPV